LTAYQTPLYNGVRQPFNAIEERCAEDSSVEQWQRLGPERENLQTLFVWNLEGGSGRELAKGVQSHPPAQLFGASAFVT